jgi:hypothetical protein
MSLQKALTYSQTQLAPTIIFIVKLYITAKLTANAVGNSFTLVNIIEQSDFEKDSPGGLKQHQITARIGNIERED